MCFGDLVCKIKVYIRWKLLRDFVFIVINLGDVGEYVGLSISGYLG